MPNAKGLLPVKAVGILIGLTLGMIAMGGAVQATPITYNVNQTIGAGGVIGTIQTDGTLGLLSNGNFLTWDLTLNGVGASYHITQADSVVQVVGSDTTATAADLFFNYSGADNGYLLFQQGLFSGMHYWCNATSLGTCFQGATVVPEAFNSPSAQNEPRAGSQVIATAAASVPEPASLALLCGALAGMGLARLRRAMRHTVWPQLSFLQII
jgi:hypothetical protein